MRSKYLLSQKSKVKVKSESQEKKKRIDKRRKWVIGCRACKSSVHMDCKTIDHKCTVLVDSLQIAALIYKIPRKKPQGRKKKVGKKDLDRREKKLQIYHIGNHMASRKNMVKKS